MIGLNLSEFEKEESITVELRHPYSGEKLTYQDKKPCTVTCHAAHTEAFRIGFSHVQKIKTRLDAIDETKADNYEAAKKETAELMRREFAISSDLAKSLVIDSDVCDENGKRIPNKDFVALLDSEASKWVVNQLIMEVYLNAGKLKKQSASV